MSDIVTKTNPIGVAKSASSSSKYLYILKQDDGQGNIIELEFPTQTELSKRTGISTRTIQNLLKNKGLLATNRGITLERKKIKGDENNEADTKNTTKIQQQQTKSKRKNIPPIKKKRTEFFYEAIKSLIDGSSASKKCRTLQECAEFFGCDMSTATAIINGKRDVRGLKIVRLVNNNNNNKAINGHNHKKLLKVPNMSTTTSSLNLNNTNTMITTTTTSNSINNNTIKNKKKKVGSKKRFLYIAS